MKLEQFEERCFADPYDRDPEFLAAIDSSPEYKAIYEEAMGFEASLKEAFQVPVPADLKESIKLHQKLDKVQTKARGGWTQWAMAASLVLTMGVAGVLGWKLHQTNQRVDQLRVATIEHVAEEYEQLSNVQRVALKDVNEKFIPFGLRVNEQIGDVTYVKICPIRNHKGVHIIVRENNQPVTIFYMHKEHIAAPVALQYRRFGGMMQAADGKNGSWAVLADQPETAKNVMNRLDVAVTRGL